MYFRNTLAHISFDIIETLNNPNKQLDLFYKILNNILSKQAPLKSKRVKRHTQPAWFNDEIKTAIFERDKLKKNREFVKYKIMRNKVTSLIKKSKKNFYNKAVTEKKNTTFIWKTLKIMTNADNSSVDRINMPHSLEFKNETILGETNILNCLNEHFINVSKIIEKK